LKKNKYLFFIPSPRSIPEVKQPIVDILYGKHDVIWMKYFEELDAYRFARDFFLKSEKDYTYFCIIPDDLVINQKGIDILFNELNNPSLELAKFDGVYPVLAGVCNLSYTTDLELSKIAAAQAIIPDPSYQNAALLWDSFIKFKDLDGFMYDIIRCLFIGFSCEFIHRSIIEKFEFRRPDHTGGLDTFLSYDLKTNKIPQFIHKKARFLHLKGLSSRIRNAISVNPDVIYTGVYEPQIIYVDSDKKAK
jgi:hypothetical protein